MIKSITFLARRSDLSPEAFRKHWREVHAPLWRDVPGGRGYVLDTPLEYHRRSDVAALEMGEFDGIAQLWFNDVASQVAASASPASPAPRPTATRWASATRAR